MQSRKEKQKTRNAKLFPGKLHNPAIKFKLESSMFSKGRSSTEIFARKYWPFHLDQFEYLSLFSHKNFLLRLIFFIFLRAQTPFFVTVRCKSYLVKQNGHEKKNVVMWRNSRRLEERAWIRRWSENERPNKFSTKVYFSLTFFFFIFFFYFFWPCFALRIAQMTPFKYA